VFLVIGAEVLGVQIVYSVLAKLLGFEDIVYEVRRERAHTGRGGRRYADVAEDADENRVVLGYDNADFCVATLSVVAE